MLRTNAEGQGELEIVYIEQLVPEDHLLRKVQRALDLRFIVDKARHLYSADNGRLSIDPVVLVMMLLLATSSGFVRNGGWCRKSR